MITLFTRYKFISNKLMYTVKDFVPAVRVFSFVVPFAIVELEFLSGFLIISFCLLLSCWTWIDDVVFFLISCRVNAVHCSWHFQPCRSTLLLCWGGKHCRIRVLQRKCRQCTFDKFSYFVPFFFCSTSDKLQLYFLCFYLALNSSVCAPKLWNNLPEHIKCSSNLRTFKNSLKTHLFKRYFNR